MPPRLLLLLPVLLGLGLASVSASRVMGAPVEVGAKWAVLVGVSDYDTEEINDLRFAVRDARALADALVQKAGFPKSNVVLLTSDSKSGPDVPSNTNISRRIAMLAGSMKPQDTFLFYFSGHGFSREGQGFLGTINTDPISLPTLKVSSLPLALLREQILELPARQRVLILDACRNDPVRNKGQGIPVSRADLLKDLRLTAKADQPKGSSIVVFSCSEGQSSFEWAAKRQGLFTYYLLDGLSGRAADGQGRLTASALGQYVRDQVPRAEFLTLRGEQQAPEMVQLGGADIVLADRVPAGPIVPQFTETPFYPLYNGRDLTGWHVEGGNGRIGCWRANGQLLSCVEAGGGALSTDREYSDFELQLQYQLMPGQLSGVGIRFPRGGWPSTGGMHIQLLDDNFPAYQTVPQVNRTGAILEQLPPRGQGQLAVPYWNGLLVRCQGPFVIVQINRREVQNFNMESYTQKVSPKAPPLAQLPRRGLIGLMGAQGPVNFRAIEVREL